MFVLDFTLIDEFATVAEMEAGRLLILTEAVLVAVGKPVAVARIVTVPGVVPAVKVMVA
jgi:hypothetical protein